MMEKAQIMKYILGLGYVKKPIMAKKGDLGDFSLDLDINSKILIT